MTSYITKDGGEREQFASGSVRDSQRGKPRYDLIPTGPLRRLAELYARGAEKYGERNWEKGQPDDRIVASLLRHIYAHLDGSDPKEDHLAAVVFNAFALMYNQDKRKEAEAATPADEDEDELPDMGFPFVPCHSVSAVLGNLQLLYYTTTTISSETKQALAGLVDDTLEFPHLTKEGVQVLRNLEAMDNMERLRTAHTWYIIHSALEGLFMGGFSPSMSFAEVEQLLLDQHHDLHVGWYSNLRLCPALVVDESTGKVSLKPIS